MCDGLLAGVRLIDERKQYYRVNGLLYYRPFLVLITDGSPDFDQDVEGTSQILVEKTNSKALAFFPMGTNEADYKTLKKFGSEPINVNTQKFSEFFAWLSNSIGRVSQSVPGANVQFAPVTFANPWRGV